MARAGHYFCFVEYRNPRHAQRALLKYDAAVVDGRAIKVEWARQSPGGESKPAAITATTVKTAELRFSNIPQVTPEKFIRDIFKDYGSCNIKLEKRNGESSGTVLFSSKEAAQKALEELTGAIVDGKEMQLECAELREDRDRENKGRGKRGRSRDDGYTRRQEDRGHKRSHTQEVSSALSTNKKPRTDPMFPDNGMTLFFRGCSLSTDESTLRPIFGTVGVCQVVINRGQQGESRGSGWVLYTSESHAKAAIELYDQQIIDGSRLTVTMNRFR